MSGSTALTLGAVLRRVKWHRLVFGLDRQSQEGMQTGDTSAPNLSLQLLL